MCANCTNQAVLTVLKVGILQKELSTYVTTIKCEFLYAECFQTFHCTYKLFFIFEVCYGMYFSRAAISGVSVLAVPLDLFCCTCYSVVF